MKSLAIGLGLLLVLVSSGCTTTNTGLVLNRFTHLPPADTVGAYPAWRYIGIKIDSEAPCPEIDGWIVRQLFQLSSRHGCSKDDPAGIEKVEKQMDGFCRYETNGARPKPLPPLVTLGLSSLEPDAVALAPALQIPGESGPLGRKIAPMLATYFAEHVGGGGAIIKERDVDPDERVRLAFLDTEPNAEGIQPRQGNSGHGHFLRLIGRDLGGLAVAISTRLALAVDKFDATTPDRSSRPPKGGSVGSFTDLAEAIHQEVAALENENRERVRAGIPKRHLVINLSIGWDGKKFGGYNETRVCDLPAGPRAVYLALEYATRQGVLIFAAAGNSQSGPHASSGPLLPAAWARGNIQGSESVGCGEDLKGPLLYAVGGVQWDGKPLSNARRDGMPELAAFGDHVVLEDLDGESTSAYTGSSVATAVVSSIAARLWQGNSEAEAGDIANQLWADGKDLYPADFVSWNRGPSHVKEVSLRSTFGDGNSEEPAPPKLSDLFEKLETTFAFQQLSAAATGCSKGSGVTCPGRLYEDYWSQPWVLPQPEDDPCPNCAMGPPRRVAMIAATDPPPPEDLILRVEISADWKSQDAKLETGTLDVELEGGSHRLYEVALPATITEPWSVRLPAADFGTTPPVRAVLTWLVSKPGGEKASINSPILVFD